MREQLQSYIEKMNRFNQFEIEYYRKLSYEQKLDRYFELVKHTFNTLTIDEIEKIHARKLQHLCDMQKLLMRLR